MNTNRLKTFAQETRLKLIRQVESRLNYVLNSDSPELREKKEQLKRLKVEIKKTSKDQLIEKVVGFDWVKR